DSTTAVLTVERADGVFVRSAPRLLDLGRLYLRVDSNNDTVIAKERTIDDGKDEQAAVEGKPFTFWESALYGTGANALLDFATISVRVKVRLAPDTRIGLRWKDATWELRRQLTIDDDYAGVRPPSCSAGEESRLRFCSAQ